MDILNPTVNMTSVPGKIVFAAPARVDAEKPFTPPIASEDTIHFGARRPIKRAVALIIDDPKLKAVVPDELLRTAIANMTLLMKDSTLLDFILETKTPTGLPRIQSIEFGKVRKPGKIKRHVNSKTRQFQLVVDPSYRHDAPTVLRVTLGMALVKALVAHYHEGAKLYWGI